jgi:GTP-binding protein EngB required for normal cell division
MFRWLKQNKPPQQNVKAFSSITEGLQRIYREQMLPMEREMLFNQFYSAELTDADFASKPMVMLIGQYSTGKSTFIRHLLGRDYPGLRIGPEPTTDKFVAVVQGDNEGVIPGQALVADKSLPFTQLSHFGNSFLARFEAARLSSPVLNGITLIDTPGVLAGEKQTIKRGYEFDAVVKWFADRVDMILVLFDVSKMDISDEFRRVLVSVRGNDSKIHLILNKADRVTTPQLMRVYGAMMWSLGKVIDTPEVSRVYIGSFWDEPLSNDEQRRLFESEENDLYTVLSQLPQSVMARKINDLIKRMRLAKVHMFVLDHLKRKLPLIGKGKAQTHLIDKLESIFEDVSRERNIPLGDFPDVRVMKEKLATMDFSKFPKLDPKAINILDNMLNKDIPKLLAMMPAELDIASDERPLAIVGQEASPFAVMKVGGATETSIFQSQWFVPPNVDDYRQQFMSIGPNQMGRIIGQKAKAQMVASKLPSNVLHKIWTLADVDKDGALTLYEFALAMHFIRMKLDGQELPQVLPSNMCPPEALLAMQ